uniref:Uncharacterized protein n=1 Tax=Schizaphis graminum TaxID=13262 RepID=A0A2S2PN68_SCHGA
MFCKYTKSGSTRIIRCYNNNKNNNNNNNNSSGDIIILYCNECFTLPRSSSSPFIPTRQQYYYNIRIRPGEKNCVGRSRNRAMSILCALYNAYYCNIIYYRRESSNLIGFA